MSQVEFLDQQPSRDPCPGGDRPDGGDEDLEKQKRGQRRVVTDHKAGQGRDAEHIDFHIYKLKKKALQKGRGLLSLVLRRMAEGNMDREIQDVRRPDVFEHVHHTGQKGAYAVDKEGAEDLHGIIARKYPEKQRSAFLPAIVCHRVQGENVSRAGRKRVDHAIDEKIAKHIYRHYRSPPAA